MSQVIKKRKIVITSVLKPVDDPRMRDKLAVSLSEHYGCEVLILGYPGKSSISDTPSIKYLSSSRFERISVARLLQPWKIFLSVVRLKPSHLIICTHELLFIGFLVRIFSGTKLIYDIRENYYQNILSLAAFPKSLRWPLAAYVRLKEVLTSPFVHLFILSDGCYQNQLNFLGSKFIVAENKVYKKNTLKTDKPKINHNTHTTLIFSGTLAESTGVFSAISIIKKLHNEDANSRLTLIGYCAKKETLKKINAEITPHDFIQLIGGDHIVPHDLIMKHIHSADFGIIAYPPNPAINGKYPTKLFEYLGAQLPIILTPNFLLETYCQPYQASISLVTKSIHGRSLLLELRQKQFYVKMPGSEILWENEAEKLFTAFSNL